MTRVNQKPVWLLDIDGVLNMGGYGRDAGRGQIRKTVNGYEIIARKRVLDFIRTVHELGLAEIRWHTTWQHDAKLFAEAFDLPNFAVADAPEFPARRSNVPHKRFGWWKVGAARRVIAEGRPLIWTDDDQDSGLNAAQLGGFAEAGALLICPDYLTGLSRRHLHAIATFLAAYTTSEVGQKIIKLAAVDR